jgi:hypothetical protein
MTKTDENPASWSAFIMDWEIPPGWRFIRKMKWKARHKRILLLEVKLNIIDGDKAEMVGWLKYWWTDPGDFF